MLSTGGKPLTLKKLEDARAKRRAKLKRELKQIVPQLKAMGAKRIIVFGSYAEGQIGLRSDLDLLVIMPPTKSGRAWMREIYDQLERQVACDILAFTEKELNISFP